MLDVVKLLSTQSTHAVALSVSNRRFSHRSDYRERSGRVEKLFREKNVPFGVCEVVVVEIREVATQLVKLLAALVMAEVNVHLLIPCSSVRVALPRSLCTWTIPNARPPC